MAHIKLYHNRITILKFVDNCHSENCIRMLLFNRLSESLG